MEIVSLIHATMRYSNSTLSVNYRQPNNSHCNRCGVRRLQCLNILHCNNINGSTNFPQGFQRGWSKFNDEWNIRPWRQNYSQNMHNLVKRRPSWLLISSVNSRPICIRRRELVAGKLSKLLGPIITYARLYVIEPTNFSPSMNVAWICGNSFHRGWSS